MNKGKFRMDIRKSLFSGRMVIHWNRLLREVTKPLSLEVFKNLVNVA